MKKVLSLIMLVSVVFGLALPLGAEEQVYQIPEWGVSMPIPDGFWMVNEDTPDGHIYFEYYGMTKAEYMDMLDEYCIYLDLVSNDFMSEIYVQIWEESDLNFNDLSEKELTDYIWSVVDDYDMNSIYTGHGISETPVTKFVWIATGEDDWSRMEYIIAYKGRMVWIVLDNYSSNRDFLEARRALDKLVQGLEFDTYVPDTVIKTLSIWLPVIFVAVFAIGLIIIVIIVVAAVAFSNKKTPAPSIPQAVGRGDEDKYCSACGTKLSSKCRYCIHCGKEQ